LRPGRTEADWNNQAVSEGLVRRRVIVQGLVQGVFFRDSVRRRAVSHGVAGWIRNRADGSVEAVFEGPEVDVIELLVYCRTGPRGARVESVSVTTEAPEGLTGFEIR
jgi:acylphosphatase